MTTTFIQLTRDEVISRGDSVYVVLAHDPARRSTRSTLVAFDASVQLTKQVMQEALEAARKIEAFAGTDRVEVTYMTGDRMDRVAYDAASDTYTRYEGKVAVYQQDGDGVSDAVAIADAPLPH